MNILNNTILSRIFAYNNMKLNYNGLFLKVKGENNKVYDIFITNNAEKISDLLGIPFDEFNQIDDLDSLFNIVIKSPFFRSDIFINNISGSEILKKFSIFLKNNNISKRYSHITKELIVSTFKDENIESRIENIQSGAAKNINILIRNKINGKIIMKHQPNYDKKLLNKTIPYFLHNCFSSELERDYFITTRTEKDIVEKFIDVTKHIVR